jgi:hypothetical protein
MLTFRCHMAGHLVQVDQRKPKLTKLHFPKFDGNNPKLWQAKCENYFDMYTVTPSVWVKVATMHFEGPVAKWLQSVHHRIHSASWSELCSWIHDRFGRDQHESLIRQLFHIKRSGSAQEYMDQFSELIVYDHSASNNCYYIARFVDGLKDDIKSVVLVQRPCDLDTTCCLALLQEEADMAMCHDLKRVDYSFKPKSSGSARPLPLPPPPTTLSKTSLGAIVVASFATINASNAQVVVIVQKNG